MVKKILTEKRILIFILFIAVFTRSIALILFMQKYDITVYDNGMSAYPLIDDSQGYYQGAINLIENKGYNISFYPPGYSVFLSILYYFFGTSILAYAIPQIILGSACCYFTYVIAKGTFSSKIGLIASFMLSVYPSIVWWTSYIRSENLFIPLQLLSIIFFMRAVKNNFASRNIILSGIFFASAFFCRNVILYLPIFIAVYLFIFFFITKRKMLIVVVATTFFLSCYIPPLLWAYRNYVCHGQFTSTADDRWAAFSGCNNLPTANLPFFDLYEIVLDYNKEVNSFSGIEGVAFVKEYPMKYSKLCLKRFLAYWSPTTKTPRFMKKVVDTFIYIFVFPMAFYGFYKSKWWLGFKPAPTLLITVIVYYTVLHSLVALDHNLIYTYPIIPLVCIFSAYGYYTYFTHNKEKNSPLYILKDKD